MSAKTEGRAAAPIVTTGAGQVVGRQAAYGIFSYLGIPYAEPPVDALRFAPPVPRAKWTGVLHATDVGHVVPQSEMVGPRAKMLRSRRCACPPHPSGR